MKVTFDYEIVTPKSGDFSPEEFIDCTSLDDLSDALLNQCPNMEWSVWPKKANVEALWEAVKKLQAEDDKS